MDLMDDEDWLDFEDWYFLNGGTANGRDPKYKIKRIDWEEHVQMKLTTKQWQSTYHMPYEHFTELVDILRGDISPHELQSMRSTGGNDPISAEIIVAATIRFLIGERIMALCDIFGISSGSANRVVNKCLNAINTSHHVLLSIKLPDPTDRQALHDLTMRWDRLSTAVGLMRGHLGAIDGWLARTEMPADVWNPLAYYSGHYACYGLNVQAVVGPSLEFLYLCVAGPGKTNDVRAFKRCDGLLAWLRALSEEYYISGDNAYILCNKVLTPHNNAQLGNSEHRRTFNYYLSQLRIRVEMAFGLLTTKWRLLRHGLNFYNAKNSLVIQVCARLHNFCLRANGDIDAIVGERIRLDDDVVRSRPADFGIEPLPHARPASDGQGEQVTNYSMGYLETVDEEENYESEMAVVDFYSELTTTDESRRLEMVANIENSGLRRPLKNIRRNG